MFNAKYPAPVCQFGMHLMTMIETIFKALAPALPGRIPAGHYSDLGVLSMSGTDPRSGAEFIHVDSSSGGWGACEGIDGESTLIAIVDGDSKNIPAEIVEHKYPLRLNQFSLYEDSGGPGKFRGGLGHIRDFEVLADDLRVLTSIERHEYRPWGLFGGSEAAVNDAILNPGRPGEREVRKVTSFPIMRGGVLRIISGGGGGYGPAWERDPARVLDDVMDGYVSEASAERDYRVVLEREGNTLAENKGKTRKLRASVQSHTARRKHGE
jgi:N-methylhydantoinase B